MNDCSDSIIDIMMTQSEQLVSDRNFLRSELIKFESKLTKIDLTISNMEEAKVILDHEIMMIQSSLKDDIDSLVTIAINIVYAERDLSFQLIFDKKPSGATGYRPAIIESGEEFDPKDEQCGGILDVVSWALRPVLHSLEVGNPRSFVWCDEPFKFLGGGVLGQRAADMRKKISTDLGIQEVIISHDAETISTADKIYNITHDGKKSIATQVFPKPTADPMKIIRRIRG